MNKNQWRQHSRRLARAWQAFVDELELEDYEMEVQAARSRDDCPVWAQELFSRILDSYDSIRCRVDELGGRIEEVEKALGQFLPHSEPRE